MSRSIHNLHARRPKSPIAAIELGVLEALWFDGDSEFCEDFFDGTTVQLLQEVCEESYAPQGL